MRSTAPQPSGRSGRRLDLGEKLRRVSRAPAFGWRQRGGVKPLTISQRSDGGLVGGGIESERRGHRLSGWADQPARKEIEVKRLAQQLPAVAVASLAIIAAGIGGAGCGSNASKDVNHAVQQGKKAVNQATKKVNQAEKSLPKNTQKDINKAKRAVNKATNQASSAVKKATK